MSLSVICLFLLADRVSMSRTSSCVRAVIDDSLSWSQSGDFIGDDPGQLAMHNVAVRATPARVAELIQTDQGAGAFAGLEVTALAQRLANRVHQRTPVHGRFLALILIHTACPNRKAMTIHAASAMAQMTFSISDIVPHDDCMIIPVCC
jgi:hypothetical protein